MNNKLHIVPGRVRVKVPALQQRPKKQNQIVDLFAEMEGIDSVSANPLTGSVVVYYDPYLTDCDRILGVMEKAGLVDAGHLRATCGDPGLSQKTADYIGRALFGYAVSKALESNGLGLLAAFI